MIQILRTTLLAVLLGAGALGAQNGDAFRSGLQALERNQLDRALADLTVAEKQKPQDARVRNFRGIALFRLGKSEEAAAEYREAIRLAPEMSEAYRNLAYLEWKANHLEAAREVLASGLKVAPDDSFARYYLGRVELDSGRYAEAFRNLEQAGVAWPDEPGFLLEAVAGYLSLHRDKDAGRVLQRTSKLTLSDAQSVRLGSLFFAARETDRGLATFQRLAQKSGGADWAKFDLALASLLAGQPTGTVNETLPLLKPEGPSPPWTLLGIALTRLGRHGEAVRAFRKAVELEPHSEERWLDLTREQMQNQEYMPAAATAQECLKFLPRSYALHLRLGAAYMAAGRYKEAEETFRDLVDRQDPLPTSAIGLAQVLLRTGRSGEAVQELAKARQRLGGSFLLVYFQGIALDRAGRPQEALAAFQEAVSMNPANAEVHQWLGKVHLRLRQTSEAIADLKEALRLEPNNRPAIRLLSQAYAIERDPQQAAKYASRIEPGSLPKTEGSETGDFFLPSFQMPAGSVH